MKILGVALVVLGIVVLVYGGIGYNRQATVLAVGGFKATVTEHRSTPFLAVAGAIALVGGILVLLLPERRTG